MLQRLDFGLVRRLRSDLDDQNVLVEESLRKLMAVFPRNNVASDVYLKVIATSQAYSTLVRTIDMDASSSQIAKLNVDELIKPGFPERRNPSRNLPSKTRHASSRYSS